VRRKYRRAFEVGGERRVLRARDVPAAPSTGSLRPSKRSGARASINSADGSRRSASTPALSTSGALPSVSAIGARA